MEIITRKRFEEIVEEMKTMFKGYSHHTANINVTETEDTVGGVTKGLIEIRLKRYDLDAYAKNSKSKISFENYKIKIEIGELTNILECDYRVEIEDLELVIALGFDYK